MTFKHKLPEYCFATEATTDNVVLLKRGDNGFYPYYDGTIKGKEAARELNDEIAVSPAQAAAMKMGSIFGWNIPGANPDNYNENGTVK
jgi:hypothetical protein